MNRSVVLLSGGLDSAVNLAKAVLDTEVVLTLTFDYGQKAANREIIAAGELAHYYRVTNTILVLPFLKDITSTALVNPNAAIPLLEKGDLDSEVAGDTAEKVWVPNRNGLFVNIAAAYADSFNCDLVITGFNAEEARTFPDNSQGFIDTTNRALEFSTLQNVRLMSYTIDMNKKQIVGLGRDLGLPFNKIWSCYFGEESPCGKCESCLRFMRWMNDTE